MKRLVVIAVLLAWAAAGCGGKEGATTTVPALGENRAEKTSPDALRELSQEVGHPIYWLGEKKDTTYELTRLSGGRIFVRYLPKGVSVGSPQALYTIVGTYPVTNAYNVVKELAKKPGQLSFSAPDKGFAVFNSSRPTNVYLAYPGSNVQIEVFDVSPKRARQIVMSGDVVPVS